MAVYLAFHVLTLLGPPKAYIYIPHPSMTIAIHSLSKGRLMSYTYYHNRRTRPRDASVPMSASTQSHHNTAHPTSHAAGAPHQGNCTTAAYPAFPPHAPVHAIPNGGYAGGSEASHRGASSCNVPGTAVVPYNTALAARNRANSSAAPRNGDPDQGRTQPSTNSSRPSTHLVPHSAILITRNRSMSNASPRNDSLPNHALRNHPSAAVPHTRRPSTASNGKNTIPFPWMGTDPIHVRADSVNVHFHYHHR
ncbi:hypothetical protein EDD18DRAFT_513370 [Armillaria luteobubalina]|uniref:Uncharacterized protein n=1 Tax=Armillaria luteobubalina TaxID=153913 RepID=A0AA39Q086_9AGAR|nr:hypothetical protein EDD18DRAFT_513370 [Armillaria luteobubalina]